MRLAILLSLLIAVPALADPTRDPITKPLSEEEARSAASRLARAAFDKRTDIKDADGKRVKTPAFPPASFQVKHASKRWTLVIDPPAGAFAPVSFGDWGDHPTIDVGFAVE